MVPGGTILPLNRLGPKDLELRCQAALELWNGGGYHYLLLAGGVCRPRAVQTQAESELMRDWFVRHGVPYALIFLDVGSVDSYENISFGLQVLRNRGLGGAEITLVTQWQHAARMAYTFRRAHGIAVRTVPLRYPVGLKTFLIEAAFNLYHRLDPYGVKRLALKNRQSRRAAARR